MTLRLGNRVLHSGATVGLVEDADLPGGSPDSLTTGAARIQLHLGLRRAPARPMEEPDPHRSHRALPKRLSTRCSAWQGLGAQQPLLLPGAR